MSMKASVSTGVVLVSLLTAGLQTAGCASRPRAEAKVDATAYMDPLRQSVLREEALEVLVHEALSESPEVRANALEGLARARSRATPHIAKALTDPSPAVRAVAAMIVGELRLGELAGSVTPLARDESEFVRLSALYALKRCGREVDLTPMATILLTSDRPQARAHAAFLLGEIGDRSAVGMLRQAAARPMPKAMPAAVSLMQLQFAEAMIKLGDTEQVEAVRAALYPARPEDLEATALAVQILGEVGDRGSIDHLINLFHRRAEGEMPAEIKLGIAASLAKLGNPEGWFLADEFRESPEPSLWAQAAMVYGVTGQVSNLPKLEALLGDPHPQVRAASAAAILSVLSGA